MDKYQVLRTIGKGSFGHVYLVFDKSEKTSYCLKAVNLQSVPAKERAACKTEVQLLHGLVHPNIVGFRESFLHSEGSFLCLVMTYCDGGDLSERLQQNKGKLFAETQILTWFVQILLGLHYMHANNVLHRDLKTQNIFLLGNGRLVLGDFGISKKLSGAQDFAKTQIGTPYYMSPEQFKSKPYSFKSDVWSLGCVLYEMTTLRHPFDGCSMNELMKKILVGRYRSISQRYSHSLKVLVKQLLCSNPLSRPSLTEVVKTRFVRSNVLEFLKDLASRPKASVGAGTMVIRNAIAPSTLKQNGMDPPSARSSNNLHSQLIELGLKNLLERVSSSVTTPEASNENVSVNLPVPRSPGRKRKARKSFRRKQAALNCNALIRAEERKRAVENALAKLKQERELRAKQKQQQRRDREARFEKQRERQELESRRKQTILNDRRKAVQLRAQQQKQEKQQSMQKATPVHGEENLESLSPPGPTQKDRVLAEKQRRQLKQEELLKQALSKAREERAEELRKAAMLHEKQFNASPENEVARQYEKNHDEQLIDGGEYPPSEDRESEVSPQIRLEFDMEAGEGSNVDLDMKEETLRQELNIAQTVCNGLRATLPLRNAGDDDEDSQTSDTEDSSTETSLSDLENSQKTSLPSTVHSSLQNRVSTLRQECLCALGEHLFGKVYAILQQSLESKLSDRHTSDDEAHVQANLQKMLGTKLEYAAKIDNLLFIQETLH